MRRLTATIAAALLNATAVQTTALAGDDERESAAINSPTNAERTWWGVEFLVCMRDAATTGQTAGDATTTCTARILEDGRPNSGTILNAVITWWGVEFREGD